MAEFLDAIDRINRILQDEPLTDVEIGILRAAWEGIPYSSAAIGGMHEGSIRNIASVLWKRLSKATQIPLNKGNFRDKISSGLLERCHLLGGVPALINPFYGRREEIAELSSLLQRYKVISVVGMEGVGKRSLLSFFLWQGISGFDSAIWLSSWYGAASAEEFVARLENLVPPPLSTEHPHSDLWTWLTNRRSLLVVEQAEKMLTGAEGTRRMHPDYYTLILRIARETSSSIVLLANEPLGQISTFHVPEAVEFPLKGLTLEDSRQVFKDYGLDSPELWDEIISSMGGHPLQLKRFAAYVSEMFGGKLSQEFLRSTIKLSILQAFYGHLTDSLTATDRALLSEVVENSPFLLDLLARYPATVEKLIKVEVLRRREDGRVTVDSLLRKYLQGQGNSDLVFSS